MPNHANRSSSAPEVSVSFEQLLCHASIGEIWLGRLLNGHDAGRVVLLRRINKQWLSPKDAGWVLSGATAYSKVRHPTLAKLLGVLEQGDELVSISEHLEGVRLADLQQAVFNEGVPIPATVAVRIVLDAARATWTAHQLATDVGIFPTERLFVPEGVWVTSFGATLLTEVGVLSALSKCVVPRTCPQLLAQLAPEELAAKTDSVGSPEVFSLGVVLWELLANRWLFSRESDSRTHQELLLAEIPGLDEVERFGMPVPDALVQLVDKAVARNPVQRFASVHELVQAFERLPQHFIASEHQVAEVLRQRASSSLKASETRPSFRARSGTFSEVRATQPSIAPPSASNHEWDRPTLAQSSLISTQIYLGNPGGSERLSTPLDAQSRQTEPSHLARRRTGRGAVWTIITLSLLVGFAVAFRWAPARLRLPLLPAPAAAVAPAPGEHRADSPAATGKERLPKGAPADAAEAAAVETEAASKTAVSPPELSASPPKSSERVAPPATKRTTSATRPSRKPKPRSTKGSHEATEANIDAQWGI